MKFKRIIFSLGIVLFVSLPILIIPRLINIEKVTCRSQFGPCNIVIQEELDSINGGNLIDIREKVKNVLAKSVLVREFYIQYKIPNTLKVDLLEAKPKYAISDKNKNIILVDARGYILTSQKTSSLPTIEVDKELKKVGEQVDENTLFAGEIIYDMFSLYSIDYGKIVEDRLEIISSDDIKIIYPLVGDREVLVGSLVAIMSRLKESNEAPRIEEVKSVSEIDLRYKNPVLR